MNGLTPKTGVTDWPPGPPPRAARGAPEPSEPFAGILDAHQARTAPAEGQDRSSRTSEHHRRDDDGPVANDRAESRSNARWARDRRDADGVERERPAKADKASDSKPADSKPAGVQQGDGTAEAPATETPATDPTATEPTAQVAADALPVAANAAAAPAAAQQAAVVQTQAAPQQVAPQAQDGQEQQAAVVDAKAAGATVPQAQSAAQSEAASATEAGGQAQAQPASKDGVPTGDRPAPANPSAQAATDKPATHADSGKQQKPDEGSPRQPGTLPQQASDQARTVAQAYGRVHQQQPQAEAPAAQPAGTPTVAATPAANGGQQVGRDGLGQATPVPLARAAETVENVLRLAAARGVMHARIALNPEQLGSIDVHLRHTADGIIARVVAHAPEAVQQLQQAAADLRRALEGQGLNLLNLDIGHSGDHAGRAGAHAGDGNGGRNAGDDQSADGTTAAGETTTNSTLQLPDGVLVDVLA